MESRRSLAKRLIDARLVKPDDLRAPALWQVGRYEVLHPLSSGAQGEVLLANDALLGRRVAIKLLRPRVSEERFRREAQSLARLKHPHVVAVHDAGLHDGRPFLVMDYVGARTLESANLPPREFVAALEQAARGCQAAHEQGLVHRDLKPTNVLLDDAGTAVVADFGVVKLLDGPTGPGLTAPMAAVGTPAYMAPEQMNGGDVGPACDLYALGVMLHEGLTGELPGVSHQVRDRFPGLAPLVESALSDDPRDRPASATAFADALRTWLDRDDETPPPRPLGVVVGVAIGALACVVLLVGALSLVRPRRATPLPPTPSPALASESPPPAPPAPTPLPPTPSPALASETPPPAPPAPTPPPTTPQPQPPTETRPAEPVTPDVTPELPATTPPVAAPPSAELAAALARISATLDGAKGSPLEVIRCWVVALGQTAEAVRLDARAPEVPRASSICCRLVGHAVLGDLVRGADHDEASSAVEVLRRAYDEPGSDPGRAAASADAELLSAMLSGADLRVAGERISQAATLDARAVGPQLTAALLHLLRARRSLPARDEAALTDARRAIADAASRQPDHAELPMLRRAVDALDAATGR